MVGKTIINNMIKKALSLFFVMLVGFSIYGCQKSPVVDSTTPSPTLASVTVSPASKTLTVGYNQTFTATGSDSSGTTVSITPTWTVTGGIGTITTSGTFSATIAGSGKVIATSGSFSGEASIVVSATPVLSTINVAPSSKTLSVGDAQTFTASGVDSSWNSIAISPTWSVTGGIGTISSLGVFTATTAGSGKVKATSDSIVGESSVTVNAVTTTDNYSVFFIDVGQGDSILVKTKDNHYVLIDSGPSDSSNAVNAYLISKGVSTLYRAILTHPHTDHYGEFKDVIGTFTISGFDYADYPSTNSTYATMITKLDSNAIPKTKVKDGDSFTLDNLTFRYYHPPASGFISTSSDENDNSLAIKISNASGTDILISGDLENSGIASLLSRHTADIDVELLKINHHGSSNGTTQALLNATTPTDAFICVGAGNSYGHPSAATLSLLATNSINAYRTDTNGSITVNVTGSTYTITTEK